ncbi:hypothetical protein CHUAL_007786 [Chamberlinius hualienensis]
MGKMKKVTLAKETRTMSLVEQMTQSEHFEVVSRRVKANKQRRENDEKVVPDKLTKKILASAIQQQHELEEEANIGGESQCRAAKSSNRPKVARLTKHQNGSSDSESEIDESGHDFDYECLNIDEEDEKALALFMNLNPPVRKTLADAIMDKITEKKTELQTQFSDIEDLKPIDEVVLDSYTLLGNVLSTYRSGKLPKLFKIIPSLSNWEQILSITKPERWSAASMYMATRIFSSNLKDKAAERFYQLVLLPRIRDDIQEFKRLNVHLYQALCKSLFKPGAFYRGFLIPLCAEGTCTLREAVIISSVLSKIKIPADKSLGALLKIAEMENYNGANSIFMQTLIKKKYALPYRVIDGLVYHFLRFQHDKRKLPVLWHQALLAFVQHYKDNISLEQKEALEDLLKVQVHHQITQEIRKELQDSKSRGETVACAKEDGMDTV